ncbi:PREDICTED: reverse mRNAase, partial [Prunus dulcis]
VFVKENPLSPYIFLLCAEGLTELISQTEREGFLKGVSICRGAPAISHFFFADNSFPFARANMANCMVLKDILDTYERASGQQVNFQKSAVCFSKNVQRGDQLMLAQFMGIPCVDHHSQYLGLPMVLDKKKGASFNHLKERLWKKLQTWKGKLLSGTEKVILIKVVAQAIPIYTMSSQFWWNSSTKNKKIHSMAWDRLCAPKEEGGLGFGNLHAFNLALLAKQGWRLLQNPDSLITRVLKAKYFPTRSFLETAVSPHASVVWKSLCEARTVIIQVSKWQCYHKSINLIHGDSREWNVTLLQNVFFPEEVMLICSIPLSLRLTPDMLVCHYDIKKSMFTVKSAYHVARSLHSSTGRASSSNLDVVARNWSLLWKAIVPARVKTFWWRVIFGILTTKANLARKKVSLDEECMLGGGPVESSIHILRDCPFAICAWRSSTLSSSRWNNDAHSPKDW